MNSRQKCKEWRIIILKYKGSLKPAWHVQIYWTQFIEFNKLNRAISKIWQFSALFFLNSISWKYQTCLLLSRNWIQENILTCCIVLMFYYILITFSLLHHSQLVFATFHIIQPRFKSGQNRLVGLHVIFAFFSK